MPRNCQDLVEQLKNDYPAEWAAAHRGGPDTEAFVRRLAWVLHSTVDANFGLLGQRGDASRIADDAILYSGEGTGVDPTTGKRHHGYDFIVGAGGPDPRPGWQRLDDGGVAVWVQPVPVGGSVEPAPGADPWTPAHTRVFDAVVARFGAPSGSSDAGFVQRLAEQFAASFPGERWGRKSVDTSRPLSGDILARLGADSRLTGYRVVPTNNQPPGLVLTGQMFRAVLAVDHLGVGQPPPVDPVDPPVDPTPVDLGPVLEELATLRAAVAALMDIVLETRAAAEQAASEAEQAATAASAARDITIDAKWLGTLRGTSTPQEQP